MDSDWPARLSRMFHPAGWVLAYSPAQAEATPPRAAAASCIDPAATGSLGEEGDWTNCAVQPVLRPVLCSVTHFHLPPWPTAPFSLGPVKCTTSR